MIPAELLETHEGLARCASFYVVVAGEHASTLSTSLFQQARLQLCIVPRAKASSGGDRPAALAQAVPRARRPRLRTVSVSGRRLRPRDRYGANGEVHEVFRWNGCRSMALAIAPMDLACWVLKGPRTSIVEKLSRSTIE